MESQGSLLDPSTDPPRADTEESFRNELRLWREGPLRGLIGAVLLACLFAATWFWLAPYGTRVLALELWATTAALAGLLLLGKRLPFVVRSGVFLSLVFAVCTASMLHFAFNPNAVVGFSTVAVAATILFGVRVALAVIGLVILAILGVCSLHAAGYAAQPENWAGLMDPADFGNGVRVAGIFGLLSTASVVGVSFLLRRTEGLAWQQSRALQALYREQAQRARLQRDLELREAALSKARELETLGRLAGSMAHDFNNALFVIWAALDELSNDPQLGEQHEEALATLRAAAEQAAATTRNLHAFGPAAPRRPSTLSVPGLISRASATLGRILPPNIRIESEIRAEVSIAADEGEFLRVLTNLALNARDAMHDGGTLTLRARPAAASEQLGDVEPGRLVAIEVSDTGTGMAQDVLERLFEPFFTTKQAAGTGLGLASVREIVRAHQGDVRVSSELGRGTTITLFWPTAVQPDVAAASAAAPATGAGRVILVVDSDSALRTALTEDLRRTGFEVIEAADAAAGLEALRRTKLQIDLLCTDWMMPGLPVRPLIEEFQRVHGGAVLVCSGNTPAQTSVAPAQVYEFIAKPFSGDELARRIQRLLAGAGRVAPPRG